MLHSRCSRPGFIFHQTERTADNGSNPCFGNSEVCFDSNTRDFDLLGYKYSLLSTIGTAGLNAVVTMIPARDSTEFALFPMEDRAFIKHWLGWTDEHATYLANTAPIATLPPPGLGVVDGTSAMAGDEGYVFLFNPSMRPHSVNLTLDESMGISNASSAASYLLTELYPRTLPLGRYAHSQQLTLKIEGSSALVLSLFTTTDADRAAALVGLTGHLHPPDPLTTQWWRWEGAEAVSGSTVIAKVSRHFAAEVATRGVSVNGVHCVPSGALPAGGALLTLSVIFGGAPAVQHAQSLGPMPPTSNQGGGWSASFAISSAIFAQLEARQAAYPVPWTAAERNATWLVPSRLLAYIMIAQPSDGWKINASIDGMAVPVHRSYNSRGLVRPRCFLGFYIDLSAISLTADTNHTLALELPGLPAGAFEGVFLENVETVYTRNVSACSVTGVH